MLQEIEQEDDIFEDLDLDDIEEEETPEPEQPEDPYANLSPEELKARLAKAEKAIVKNKRKPDQTKPVTNKTPVKEPDEKPDWAKEMIIKDAKRDFGYQKQLSPEAVDALFKYNGGQVPSDDMLESDEAAKAIVQRFRSKERVANNTPRGGSVPTYKGKTYAEVAADPSATPADKQAAFEAQAKARGIK